MPAQSRNTPTTTAPTTAPETAAPAVAPDLTGGRGNAAAAGDVSTAAPESSVLEQEPTKNKQERSGDVDRVTLSSGKAYIVNDKDMAASDPWRQIARNNGMTPERLQAFNQHVTEVNVGGTTQEMPLPPAQLAVGVEIYIPSAQELAFAECRRKAKSYDEAISLYGKLTAGPNIKLLDAATFRASGEIGESYGTKGVDGGKFYTPNPTIAGARKGPVVGGKQQYKVFWLAEFWKCSVFMNDAVFQAGYKPAQTANNHYATAGTADKNPVYKAVKAADAMPGDCWQRFGGTGSDQSHNAVLSTFVDIVDLGNGTETWTFSIIGSEVERAAESKLVSTIDKATGMVTEGYGVGNKLNFFRPVAKR